MPAACKRAPRLVPREALAPPESITGSQPRSISDEKSPRLRRHVLLPRPKAATEASAGRAIIRWHNVRGARCPCAERLPVPNGAPLWPAQAPTMIPPTGSEPSASQGGCSRQLPTPRPLRRIEIQPALVTANPPTGSCKCVRDGGGRRRTPSRQPLEKCSV
ncbi:hypothetical protein B0T14DRAFT_526338 [Immersiella caudata]|uniref:Uncharacterized protein n=1 Tax=Immersiella caudata TaxID=314043 RepID=A0AA40BTW7_9PEZI|nr:hypothetical protein B0T14DRAFT_526338 [Immersiella caudata]